MKGRSATRRFGRSALLGLVGALACACATDRAVISQAEDTNRHLEPAIMNDAQLAGYLQKIGGRIVEAARAVDAEHQGPKSHFSESDNSWMFENKEFHLVNSKTLNAFTTGGDHMYVYSQLFQQCKSEDELAAVMAHEFAHVYCRHVHKGMNRQLTALGLSAGAGLAGLAVGGEQHGEEYAGLAAVSTAAATSFLNLGYTRDDEAGRTSGASPSTRTRAGTRRTSATSSGALRGPQPSPGIGATPRSRAAGRARALPRAAAGAGTGASRRSPTPRASSRSAAHRAVARRCRRASR
jgi:hypothetical protein